MSREPPSAKQILIPYSLATIATMFAWKHIRTGGLNWDNGLILIDFIATWVFLAMCFNAAFFIYGFTCKYVDNRQLDLDAGDYEAAMHFFSASVVSVVAFYFLLIAK